VNEKSHMLAQLRPFFSWPELGSCSLNSDE